MNAMHAWAWRHASFLLIRYVRKVGPSSFKLINGRPYAGKLAGFGESVYASVKSSVKGKARWVRMLWVGKLIVSDLHVGAASSGHLVCSGSVRRLPSSQAGVSSRMEVREQASPTL